MTTSRSDPITRAPEPFDHWAWGKAAMFEIGGNTIMVRGDDALTLATSLVNAYRYDQMIKRMRVNPRERS